jgi:drug/metabolite transporter (DMT)-like permease
VLGIAVLSPLSYVLVLAALTRAPVSLVAPAREGSVVLGAFLGARMLGEGHATRRIVAAMAIALGIAGLALG